ncbi:HYC_CC_PP family protein [Echinicola pacifica]|uniref:HYC_CC_PP family protein n=1 Tax=Echinicola pacifica TaxID=346377 RepID=UPI0012FCE9D0|nr:hypothetical protein [Echinicola pacifica]
MRNSVSILLAILLLFANIGVVKSSHICMGSEMLKAVGLSAQDLDCGMEHSPKSSSSPFGEFEEASDCCKNQFELMHSETDQNLKLISTYSPQLIFIAAFTAVFVFGRDTLSESIASPIFISPPPIWRDYTVLFQSFLL